MVVELWCGVLGHGHMFPVNVRRAKTVHDLKQKILCMMRKEVDPTVNFLDLKLFLARNRDRPHAYVTQYRQMLPGRSLKEYISMAWLPEKTVHVLVQVARPLVLVEYEPPVQPRDYVPSGPSFDEETVMLSCGVVNDGWIFKVDMSPTATVADLQKAALRYEWTDIEASDLQLYVARNERGEWMRTDRTVCERLEAGVDLAPYARMLPAHKVQDYVDLASLPEKQLHVLVVRPMKKIAKHAAPLKNESVSLESGHPISEDANAWKTPAEQMVQMCKVQLDETIEERASEAAELRQEANCAGFNECTNVFAVKMADPTVETVHAREMELIMHGDDQGVSNGVQDLSLECSQSPTYRPVLT